ncbi:MAG: hypothetical protein J1E65_04010 [Lachnospiraceae bacterium]|nr:hypothetical protein [Lachnospiraceae bacterium]
MKKTMKRFFASLLAFTMTFATLSLTAAAEGEEFDMFIAIGADAEAENDWGFQYYGEGADNVGDVVATNGELKSGETTTLTLEFPSPVVYTWFVAPCMIVDDSSAISAQSTFDIKVYLDGEEADVDLAAGDAFWAEGTGPYAGEQCIRIAGGYNEWGTKYIAESPAGFSSISFEITPTIYVGGAAEEETGSAAGDFDPNGTYHAYLGLQTPHWTYRDGWNSDNGIGSDNWGQFVKNNDSGETFGVVTDAVIAGNGTYTVSITDFGTVFVDDFAAEGKDCFNLIYVDTDIPLSDAVTVTDVQLKIDGSTKHTVDVGYQSPDDKDYVNIMIQNIWNNDIKEISYYPAPTTSLEITFTISGFAYDAAPAEEAPAENTAPAESAAPAETTESGSNTGLIVGIVAAVVVVAGGAAGVVVAKKKKGNK